MRLLVLASITSLSVATALACTHGGDDGESGAADLNAADAGAPSPEDALVGAWVTQDGTGGPTAVIISLAGSGAPGALTIHIDSPHKKVAGDTPDIGDRERDDLSANFMFADAPGNGTLQMKEFVDVAGANEENETYSFALESDGGVDKLTLTETRVTFVKHSFAQNPGADIVVDAGAAASTLRPPLVLTRAPSFCGAGGNNDCDDQFDNGILKLAIPDACQGREEVCLSCNPQHQCNVRVPSTCELAHFSCVDSVEKCEFADNSTGTAGEVTTMTSDGTPVDCKGSPTGKSTCCLTFDRRGD